MGELALSRFEIRGVLGRGGHGVVYEAFDTRDQALVAVKTIAHPQADDLLRLKQEFRSLADIHHPNLVRYGELACERDQWFFTMELVRGEGFLSYVRPGAPVSPHDVTRSERSLASRVQTARSPLAASEKPGSEAPPSSRPDARFDETRLRSALGQLVSALLAVHARGRVHRDVKPSNTLVMKDGRLVLLDFGLATALGTGSSSALDDEVVGTPVFMAPEQTEGGPVGPAADWYAVGVMLFAALTGSLPFDGDAADVLAAKTQRSAPAPRDRAAGVPADLDALCVDLLRTSPADRPRGADIAARLGLPSTETFPSAPRSIQAPSDPRASLPETPSIPFVGRADELRALHDALAEVRAISRGRVVLVEGEPGIGKSSLVQRFLAQLPADVLALSGRCYEQESVPFKGIDGIIDVLSEHLLALPSRDVERLLKGGIRYLAAVFPVLLRVPAIRRAAPPDRDLADRSSLREQALRELEGLLGALSTNRALVLFVDDLQWADPDSLSLLRRLRGNSGPPCLLVATLRSGAGDASDDLSWVRGAPRVALHALSPDESRAFLDATASTTKQGKEALVEEAQGHPLFLAELARRVSQAPGLDPHARLEDVLWARVQERDAIDQRLLEMVAVAGAPFPYDVIARSAGVDVGECQTRLAPLRAAHLLRVGRRGDDRVIEPYHDRIRESIMARLAARGGVTERHLRLGRALLDATSADALPGRVFAIVHHLNAAHDHLGTPAERHRVAELDLLASQQAGLVTAHAGARDYAVAGLALLGATAWSDAYRTARDLLLSRMVAESSIGDGEGARACFEEARERFAAADRTKLYTTWIGLLTSRGKHDDAIEAGRSRLRELGCNAPARPSKIAVLGRYLLCKTRQGRRSTSDLLHLPALEDPVRQGILQIVVALAPVAFFVDTNLLAWLELEGAALSMKYGVSDVSSYCFAVYGTVLSSVFGRHAEGEAFGRLALALNERFQNRDLAARLHFLYGGWHSSWVRPFEDGIAFLRTSHELAVEHGDTAYETYSASTRALVELSAAIDLSSLEATSEWAVDVGKRRNDTDMTGFAEVFARYAAALQSKTASRRDLSQPASSDTEFRATLTDASTPSAVFYYLYCDAELAYLAGEPARAQALLDEAWKRTQVVFGLPTFVDLTFLDALVSARLHDGAARGDRGRLERRAAKRVRALRGWTKSCAANFEPYDLVAAAELARVRGHAEEATALFARAVTAARAHRSLKREIFALELAAAHAERTGDKDAARDLLREAADACRRWGARPERLFA